MQLSTIGLDLAKNVFHVVGFDEHNKEVIKRMLRRAELRPFFANLSPCNIGMEACASAHYWARELQALGHQVRLIPAQHVKPYVQGNKNDYNDARGIREALLRPNMRFVGIKTQAQQDIQSLHRIRSQCIKQRTGLGNSLRGLLAEYGVIFSKGLAPLRRGIAKLLGTPHPAISAVLQGYLQQSFEHLQQLDEHIAFYDAQLKQRAQEDEACRRLQTIPGFGAVSASAFVSAIGDGQAFRRGRDVSAALGLVPGQYTTGGKERLLGISKRGDRYVRSLLVHGARAVVSRARNKEDALSRWINRLVERRGMNKATVALANKMARMGWAILSQGGEYQPKAV